MEVHILEALDDNYMYLIVDAASREAAVVDPAEAEKAVAAASRHNAKLTTVLCTHHHWDHAGGNDAMKALVPGIDVVGGERDAIQGKTRDVRDDETLRIGALTVRCILTPCHTAGHISYMVTAPGATPAVFTGDVLFVCGCGRFFEGGPADMHRSLSKLGALPPETLVYVGHEYTLKNLSFAAAVEPQNRSLQERIAWARKRREAGEFTVPSTIGSELACNPFMRVCQPCVQEYCGTMNTGGTGGGEVPVETMRILRGKKDNFK